MKSRIKSRSSALLATALLCTVGSATTQAASSTIVTFSVDMGTNILNGTFTPGVDTVSAHGSFDGWGTGTNLVQEGTSTVYTNTVNDTTDANGGVMTFKYVSSRSGAGGGYEQLPDGQNRGVLLPSVSGSSLVLPAPFWGDAGEQTFSNVMTFQVDMSQQINLGAFTNDSSTIEVRGTFNGWGSGVSVLTHDTSILRTNQYGLVTSNVYTGTFGMTGSPYANMGYKFVENGNYESSPVQSDGANRFFTMSNNTPLVVPVVFYSDAPFAPVSEVTFSVDMSVVALTDTNYNPASVTINGDVMGWGGVAMTNNPNAANTNIYSMTFAIGEGSPVNYQYRYTQLSTGNTVYDHANGANGGNNNRYLSVPLVLTYNVPVVFFNDAALDDYLTQPTPVLFSVDMTGAVGTDGHVFDPATDNVYINGQFANWYAWAGGVNPTPAPPGYQMVEQGLSMTYTNTLVIPAGTPVGFSYKYGMDFPPLVGGPQDDEAGFGLNHYRVVRSTGFNPYAMPQDKFGTQYGEPFFNVNSKGAANLAIGPASGGTVPVSWLGRPGAHLQSKTTLGNGAWQDLWVTDGTNWTSGFSSTNGFVSVTNYPASGGQVFFRVVKP